MSRSEDKSATIAGAISRADYKPLSSRQIVPSNRCSDIRSPPHLPEE
jgi:hypothetical protein